MHMRVTISLLLICLLPFHLLVLDSFDSTNLSYSETAAPLKENIASTPLLQTSQITQNQSGLMMTLKPKWEWTESSEVLWGLASGDFDGNKHVIKNFKC